MPYVTLRQLDQANFSYRSTNVTCPAISASFKWDEPVKHALQRRYPSALWNRGMSAWLLPKTSIEDVTEFFAEREYLVLMAGGKVLHDPRKAKSV